MAVSKSERGSFASDLRTLLESGKGADVTFAVGASQLPAHSFILAARSPVFAAMLQNDMREASSRHIEVTDVREAVLEQLLSFIYTDTTPQMKSVAAELLAAADKYDLPLLKERCERQLAQDLGVENAAGTVTLAILHCCPELKKTAVKFIVSHPGVMATAGWAQLVRDSAEAVVEICKQLPVAQTQPTPQLVPSNTAMAKSTGQQSLQRIVPQQILQKMTTKLIEAAWYGWAREVWALLTAGVPKDSRDGSGNTALHLAVAKGHTSTVKCLLEGGLDAKAVNADKQTPLHSAAKGGNTDIIWMLVAASSEVNALDKLGQTPLHVAAKQELQMYTQPDKLVRVVNVLLLAGARKDIKDIGGKTPEHVATSSTKSAFSTSFSPHNL